MAQNKHTEMARTEDLTLWTDAWGHCMGGARRTLGSNRIQLHKKTKSVMWFLFPYTLSKLKASHWIWRLTGFCKIHILAWFHHIVKVGLDEKKPQRFKNWNHLYAPILAITSAEYSLSTYTSQPEKHLRAELRFYKFILLNYRYTFW